MVTYINKLKSSFRFYAPNTNDLEDSLWVKPLAIASRLSDGQLIALTLNEVCALRGRGEFLWVSNNSPDVGTHN